nr:uncharacterized protein LOC117995145 [Maniola hyperantus]
MELNKEALTGKPKSSHRNNTKVRRTKNKPQLKDAATQTETLLMIKTVKPTPRKRTGRHFGRSPATTAFVRPKNNNNSIKEPNNIKILDTEVAPLFKNDLIDIIAEKHDKMLSRVLHRSPDRLDTSRRPSSLNLFSPYKPGKKSTSRKKTRPWR